MIVRTSIFCRELAVGVFKNAGDKNLFLDPFRKILNLANFGILDLK